MSVKMPKPLEKFYPYLLAVLASIAFYFFGKVPSFLGGVFPQVIIIASINIGFLANALSMVSFSETESLMALKLQALQRTEDLQNYLIAAIQWNLYSAGFSIFCLMVFESKSLALVHFFSSLWIGVGVAGFLTTYRVMTIFFEAWRSVK